MPGKAVAFGVQFLDRPDRAHQPNEGVNLEDLKISAKMFVRPTPALEYVEIDFVVTPQGVEWDE